MLTRHHFTCLLAILVPLLICAEAITAERNSISITGTIQDRDGKVISGASVSVIDDKDEWTTETSERGSFELKDVPAEGAFLLVKHEGFRMHGEPLTAAVEPRVCRLTRTTEVVDEALVGKDWSIPRDERVMLIHRVFDPYLKQILSADKDNDKIRPMELLAKIDPERALELLETAPFKDPYMGFVVRGRVLEHLAHSDTQAAMEIAEGFDDGYMRSFSFMRISQSAPDLPKADRIALLSRAAADVRSVKNPAQRIVIMGLIADAILDAGERPTAEKLFRETQEAAGKVANAAWAGFARGAFAEKLARIDLAAALPLVTDLADDSERIRHLGNMAHELAAIDPASAERVLNMIERPQNSRSVIDERDRYAVRVCYRMATQDLARAQQIAESCHEKNQQAYGFGVIAHAIAQDDPEQATRILRHAYQLLNDGQRDPQTIKVHAAQIAGALLPTAEHIDPTLVREMIWHTIALRTPQIDDPRYRAWSGQQTAQLATWLSRYDRDVARTLLDVWLRDQQLPMGRGQSTVALTLVDPMRAVQIAEDTDDLTNRTRYIVAKTLAAEGESRIRIPHREAGLWPIDAEDIDW